MDTLRTPDECFTDLPDFGYQPRYADVTDPDGGTLRMAYVQAGPEQGRPVLLLHGEPSWSYLYRHVMPVLAAAGLRAIAPDLIGFGRSDKPVDVAEHSYQRQLDWVRELVVDRLDLREAILMGQDWGGLLGLRLVAEQPDRFAGVVAANTGLPTGDHDMPEVWWQFRDAVVRAERLEVGRLVQAGTTTQLPDAVVAAYDAPFPEERYKAGPRAMPDLVPTSTSDPATAANRAAWEQLQQWRKPFLVAFSDSDPITGAMAPVLRRLIPGTEGLEHPVITGAGHFLQEDAGARLGEVITGLAARVSSGG